MKQQLTGRDRQQGAVLIVALVLLMATTFIGFSAMETSSLGSRMASARALKETTFQAAEAVIEMSLDDLDYIGRAYSVGLQNSNDWPTRNYGFAHDDKLAGTSAVRFLNRASAPGYSIRRGASGIATYYYEVEATASRTGTSISNTHVQGIYVEGPGTN